MHTNKTSRLPLFPLRIPTRLSSIMVICAGVGAGVMRSRIQIPAMDHDRTEHQLALDEQSLKRHLKLRQLVVFDAVLAEGSLVKAAEVLSLTQPAVTKTVQAMEEILGVPLLQRTSRGIVATIYGRAVGARIKAVLAEVRYLGDDLTTLAAGKGGHIVVGTLISAAAWLLPEAIVRLKERSPEVVVTLQEGTNDQLMPQLITGEIDLVIGRVPDKVYAGVHHEAFYDEQLCAVARVGHPLAAAGRLNIADLADFPWILPIPDSPVRAVAEQLFRDGGRPLPRNRMDSLSILTNVSIMRRSDAVCLLPRDVANHYVRQQVLTILPLRQTVPFGRMGLSRAAERNQTPAAHALIEALREAAGDHDSPP
ncbi:MAG: LysR family transcriptional regulator [Aquisalimonadaceae bacterium]